MPGLIIYFIGTLCTHLVLGANFRTANIYGSKMVLQMEPKSSHIWGYGEIGAEVILTNNELKLNRTIVKEDETWNLRLPPTPEGGPHELKLTHTNTTGTVKEVILSDVLFGDVWFCAGEENMEFFMNSVIDAEEEMLLAETYKNIRLLHIGHDLSDVEWLEPRLLEHPWSYLDNFTIPWFSAVCLIYAEQMSDAFNGRPIGVVEAAWTRTALQSWVAANVTAECQIPPSTIGNGNSDHSLYHNAAIYPLMRLTLRGALWNHGETSEELTMDNFTCATSKMVQYWRNSFIDANVPAIGGAFPFGIVQVGANSNASDTEVSRVRLMQSTFLDAENYPDNAIPEAFTAATYDLVDYEPLLLKDFEATYKDKRTVATRLAKAALELLKPTNSRTALGPKFSLKTMTYDSEVEIVSLTYDTDVTFLDITGFGYGTSLDNLTNTEIVQTSGRSLTVRVDPSAKLLVYAHQKKPCEFLNCSVYSDDEERLPAAVVMVPFNSASHITPILSFVTLIIYILF